MVSPCPYRSEADYQASVRSEWRHRAHSSHRAARAASPWGPKQEAPPTFEECVAASPVIMLVMIEFQHLGAGAFAASLAF